VLAPIYFIPWFTDITSGAFKKKKEQGKPGGSKLLFSFFILHPSRQHPAPSFAPPYINFHLVHPHSGEARERGGGGGWGGESWKTNDARYPTWQKREKTPTRISAASGVK